MTYKTSPQFFAKVSFEEAPIFSIAMRQKPCSEETLNIYTATLDTNSVDNVDVAAVD